VPSCRLQQHINITPRLLFRLWNQNAPLFCYLPNLRTIVSGVVYGFGNLQTLGTLINIDLPWNPTCLEQCIGRIKRFGQKRETVDMLNLVNEQTVDEKMDEFINAQKEATGLDLRYTCTMEPPEKDWRDCSEVLSHRDFAVLMSTGWTG
jgi:hypothetical protein